MGNTAQKGAYLIETKDLIRDAIISKGEQVPESDPFRTYPQHIRNIKTAPVLQEKTINITKNGTQEITYDEGYNGLAKVTANINVDTTSNLAVQRSCGLDLDEGGTKQFTIPAGKKYAIVTCVSNSKYNTPWGGFTAKASKGTISQLHNDSHTFDIYVNTRLQVFKLVNTTGSASVITLTRDFEGDASYGDCHAHITVAY